MISEEASSSSSNTPKAEKELLIEGQILDSNTRIQPLSNLFKTQDSKNFSTWDIPASNFNAESVLQLQRVNEHEELERQIKEMRELERKEEKKKREKREREKKRKLEFLKELGERRREQEFEHQRRKELEKQRKEERKKAWEKTQREEERRQRERLKEKLREKSRRLRFTQETFSRTKSSLQLMRETMKARRTPAGSPPLIQRERSEAEAWLWKKKPSEKRFKPASVRAIDMNTEFVSNVHREIQRGPSQDYKNPRKKQPNFSSKRNFSKRPKLQSQTREPTPVNPSKAGSLHSRKSSLINPLQKEEAENSHKDIFRLVYFLKEECREGRRTQCPKLGQKALHKSLGKLKKKELLEKEMQRKRSQLLASKPLGKSSVQASSTSNKFQFLARRKGRLTRRGRKGIVEEIENLRKLENFERIERNRKFLRIGRAEESAEVSGRTEVEGRGSRIAKMRRR